MRRTAADPSPLGVGSHDALHEHEGDDDAFLDRVAASLLDEIAGAPSTLEARCTERPHLRERILRLAASARIAANCRPAVRPVVAGYELVRELGRGGMGRVHLARQRSLARLVALKILPRDACASPRARQRFLHEAFALARLKHPNVVQIHDVVDDGDVVA